MKQRIITGIVMALILIPILLLGSWFMVACAALLAYIGTYELIKMHCEKGKLSNIDQYIIPLASTFIVVLGGFVMLTDFVNLKHMFLALLSILFIVMIFSLITKNHKTSDFMIFYSFILYGGLGIFLAVSSRFVTEINGDVVSFVGLILLGYLAICTMTTDIGAYMFGSLLGKHKLCPTISPKKTIEGAIGGSITGTILGTIFLLLFESILNFNLLGIENALLNCASIFGLSLAITIIGQMGDLIASKLKREYGIKDYGFIFPGHGGVMDRFDSLIFSGSLFFVIMQIIYIFL